MTLNIANSIVFVTGACQTPDVLVQLGSHSPSEFKGVGTFTGSTSFNIALNSCPAGLGAVLQPAIQYRIDPVTTVVNSAQSVVALSAGSSATGVGVQLLDNAGAVLPLSKLKTFSGYNSGGGNFTIPLKARYYQTDSNVGAGTANTTMTFTMTYY